MSMSDRQVLDMPAIRLRGPSTFFDSNNEDRSSDTSKRLTGINRASTWHGKRPLALTLVCSLLVLLAVGGFFYQRYRFYNAIDREFSLRVQEKEMMHQKLADQENVRPLRAALASISSATLVPSYKVEMLQSASKRVNVLSAHAFNSDQVAIVLESNLEPGVLELARCQFGSTTQKVTVLINLERNPKENPHHFGPLTVTCRFLSEAQPLHVDLIMPDNKDSVNEISVTGHKTPMKKEELVICGSPFHHFGKVPMDPLGFIEWIEYFLIMGVSRIYAYAYHVDPAIAHVLNYYTNQRKVLITADYTEVQKTGRAYEVAPRSNNNMQLMAENDCLYRNKNTARWIWNGDFDEFAYPVHAHNLTQLLRQWDEDPKLSDVASFNLGNYFMTTDCLPFSVTESELATVNRPLRLDKFYGSDNTKWDAELLGFGGGRGKYFSRVEKMDLMHSHRAQIFSGRQLFMGPEEVHMKHYRENCKTMQDPNRALDRGEQEVNSLLQEKTVLDTGMARFAVELRRNVAHAVKDIELSLGP